MKSLTPFLMLTASLVAAEWPQFRGPDGNGVIAGKAPQKWSTDEGVVWKQEVPGDGWSSPVVANGTIFVTSATEKGGGTVLGVHAFDLKTGKPKWSADLFKPEDDELSARHSKNSLASATPAIGDGVIYAHFGHMGTAALKIDDGKVLWSRQLDYPPMHGNGSSPVLAGNLLILNADAEKDPAVYALDWKTGETRWRTPRNQEVSRTFSFCTPIVIENDGRTEIISPGSGMVGAYAPKDGKLLWKVTYGEGFSVVPRPVTDGKQLFVATGFLKPQLLAIRLGGAKGDVTDSHLEWTVKRRIPKTPSFILNDDQLVVLDDAGFLSGFDTATGDEVWREKLIGNFSSSPLLCGNTLYCLTEDGIAYVLKLGKTGAQTLSEIDMGERLFASPAVIDGHLILRSEKHLWRIKGT